VHLASSAAVLAGAGLLIAARRRLPGTAAAFLVYAVAVSPVLGFVQSGFQKVADRYSYLACMPFALLAGAGLARALGAARWRIPAALAASAWLALLGALAWRQTLVWKDSETLYERVVAVEPDNYFGWHNLAIQYQLQGRYDEALEAERRSVEHHPGRGNLPARVNLAHLLARTGRAEESRAAWRGILEVDPAHAEALRVLVRDLLQEGLAGEAEALIESSLACAPGFVEGYAELAGLHARRGEPERAVAVWERAVAAAPASARAHHGLGAALLAEGRDQEAGASLEKAFHMDNRDVEIAVDFARVLARTGHADVAQGLIAQVLAASPGHPRALAAERALKAGARP
jgi:tetratricopeptide (TPR) repeat protein